MTDKILDQLPPFSFLTLKERESLSASSTLTSFNRGEIICQPSDSDYDHLYIVVKGLVSVNINNKIKGYIHAPSYFGELSVFFSQPRGATITAENYVECWRVEGNIVRNLINENSSFRYSFATILKDKQNIFHDYQTFLARLIDKKKQLNFSMRELLPLYKKLQPILHHGCNYAEIDFSALSYVVNRIGFDITSASTICLSEDLRVTFREIKNVLKNEASRFNKKYSFNIHPGKILVLLRDDTSDFINLITKLALYLIEVNKIFNRISHSIPVVTLLTKNFFGKNHVIPEEKIIATLPFTNHEIIELKKIFGKNYLKKLYEILAQQGDISLQFLATEVRYYAISPELWINQINNFLIKHFDEQDLSERQIHIISSNVHSVRNCLSSWLHNHSDEIISWTTLNSPLSDELESPADQLYASYNSWFKHFPEKIDERENDDEKNGIYFLQDTCLTGINVTVIDMKKLGNNIDPYLIKKKSKDIIINIDYAFGRQAEIILRRLVLLFNRRISSISIFGKAGGMLGKRGDVILPNKILLQEKDDVIFDVDQDVTDKDFANFDWYRDIYKGGLLTVQGTLMQSRTLLMYYQLFWDIVGIEMEGGYYMREINSAKLYGFLNNKIKIRFVYYLSDIPLAPEENLSVRMRLDEGIPAVYTITRCVLQKIFDSEG